jgi:hypothetical protein
MCTDVGADIGNYDRHYCLPSSIRGGDQEVWQAALHLAMLSKVALLNGSGKCACSAVE